jgi:hypothetical protein
MDETSPHWFEKRRDRRRVTAIPAVIVFDAARERLPCMVRNMSTGGAKLEVFSQSQIPVTFELLVRGELIPCRLIWRNLMECGVDFGTR